MLPPELQEIIARLLGGGAASLVDRRWRAAALSRPLPPSLARVAALVARPDAADAIPHYLRRCGIHPAQGGVFEDFERLLPSSYYSQEFDMPYSPSRVAILDDILTMKYADDDGGDRFAAWVYSSYGLARHFYGDPAQLEIFARFPLSDACELCDLLRWVYGRYGPPDNPREMYQALLGVLELHDGGHHMYSRTRGEVAKETEDAARVFAGMPGFEL